MKDRFETFTLQIAKISRCIRKLKTEEMKEFQLKTPHVACIYYLYSKGPMTAKDLSDICDEDKAAVSRALIYLEKKDYVFYESKARKRYKEPIMLTEKGKKIGRIIEEKIGKILQQSSNGLTLEELATFYHGLSVIGQNLQMLCDNYEE
jgi:DNA-binding MarR family transcriptional regulator